MDEIVSSTFTNIVDAGTRTRFIENKILDNYRATRDLLDELGANSLSQGKIPMDIGACAVKPEERGATPPAASEEPWNPTAQQWYPSQQGWNPSAAPTDPSAELNAFQKGKGNKGKGKGGKHGDGSCNTCGSHDHLAR